MRQRMGQENRKECEETKRVKFRPVENIGTCDCRPFIVIDQKCSQKKSPCEQLAQFSDRNRRRSLSPINVLEFAVE